MSDKTVTKDNTSSTKEKAVSTSPKKKASSSSLPGTNKNHIRTIRILAFLIPAIAVLIGMLAGSFAPFGTKDVMTSGGMTEHLTYYYELYDKVHGGDGLIYSLTSGLGYDFTTVFTYYLSDPINLLILLFPRTAILSVLNLLYLLKIGAAGLFMSIFLTRRKARVLARREAMEAKRADAIAEIAERRKAKKELERSKAKQKGAKERKDFKIGGSEAPKTAIGTLLSLLDIPNLGFSVAFALSAYMIGQGLDVSHLTVVVIFPLILMALDNLLENGSWKLYAALMTLSVFCSFYMTIIVFIFSILYTAAYDYTNVTGAVRNILYKLISDLLAAGAGAVIILNCAGSQFISDELSIKFPYGGVLTTFFDVFKKLMPASAPASTEYYGYGLDIFCGILALFLAMLYLMNPNISLRRRISQTCILAALTTGMIFVTPNYLFNGLFYTPTNLCVFAFLFVFQLISMAYEEFLNLEHTTIWQLNIAALAFLVLVVSSLIHCDGYSSMKPFLTGMEFLMAYYILIILYHSNSLTKRLLVTLLPLILMGEILYTYVDDLRAVGAASGKYEDTTEYKMYEISRTIHASEPDAKILFHKDTGNSEPVSNALYGYDYVLMPEENKHPDSMLTLSRVENGIAVYQNPYALEAFFLPRNVDSLNYSSSYPFSSMNRLAEKVLGVGPVYENADGEFSVGQAVIFDPNNKEDPRKSSIAFFYDTEKRGDLYTYTYNIHHMGEYDPATGYTYYFKVYDWVDIMMSTNPEYYFFQKEGFTAFYEALVKAGMVRNSSLSYTYSIDAPEDGYLVIPCQNTSGWSADGYSVISDGFMKGFIQIPVSKGSSSVTVEYRPGLFYIGLAVSLCFLLVLILLAVKDALRVSESSAAISGTARFISKYYVFLLIAAITTVVFLIMQCYSASIPFGKNSILIGDGYVQVYHGYRGLMNDIKNGSFSILNWNMGVAIDRYGDFASYMTSPWSLLKMYLLPESWAFIDLTVGHLISLIVPGLYLILYLTHRRRGPVMKVTDWRLIVIGVAYNLCSYSISYFVYSGFGFLSTAPLILLGMELLVYDKKPFLYVLFLFGFMGDAYYAFMLCEFIFLYFFTMEFKSIKDMFQKGIRILLYSVASAALCCYKLIPYFFRTLDSPYKTGDSVSPITKSGGSYLSVFADSMGFRPPVTVTNNDFEANIYIGILVLFFVPLYLMNKKVPLSVRIRRIILVAVFFAAFGSSTLNYVFHGFHYQSQVPNRFAAFYVLLLFVMFYEVLVSWRDYKGKTFALGIGGSFVVCVSLWVAAHMTGSDISVTSESSIFPEDYDLAFYATMVFAVIYLALALIQLWKKHRDTVRKAMVGICLVEIILSAFVTFQKAIGLSIPYSDTDTYINRLAARNSGMTEDFHATEIVGNKEYNTSEVTNISSISAFSSMMSNAHLALARKWGIITSSNVIYYQFSGNLLSDMMLHVNYLITDETNDGSTPYPSIDQEATLTLHENPYYLPAGIWFPNSPELTYWSENDYTCFDDNCLAYHNAFSKAMGCGDLYHEIEPETDPSRITDETKASLNYIAADSSDYTAGLTTEVKTQVHIAEDVEGDIYASYYGTVVYLGHSEAGKDDTFEFTMYLPVYKSVEKDYYIRIATSDTAEMDKLYKKLSACTMQDADIQFASISGTINAPEDGMLYLSIPNMSQWKFTIDGQEVESITYLGGVGLSVTAGQHTIRVSFVPTGMWIGISISVATLILLIIVAIIRYRKKKAKKAPAAITEAK